MTATLLVGCASSTPHPAAPAPEIANPGTTMIVGELHGTREIPAAFGTLVAAAKHPIVGLEISRADQPKLDAYLASNGDAAAKAALLEGRWAYPDGRSSEAMLALIDQLRVAHVPIVAFDIADDLDDENVREKTMTEPLLAARRAHPEAALFVLTGSFHAALAPIGDSNIQRMAQRLKNDIPDLRSLAIDWMSGSTWICTGFNQCGVQDLPMHTEGDPTVRTTMDPEKTAEGVVLYDGHLHVGHISASPPAKKAAPLHLE
ncbi:MAG: hypothetical protein QM831_45835 [Kofleriaceae bacterium]